jgi:ADP-ribosylation/crystallin J1
MHSLKAKILASREKSIYNAACEVLPAIAYGDAAGLPVEAMSAEQISENYGRITELQAPSDHPFFSGSARGTVSDDTQLSLAVAESLMRTGGFSIESLADEHIAAYRQAPRTAEGVPCGWGGSTVKAVERMISGVPPRESGEKGKAGNGVVMKMAPLVVWQVLGEVDGRTRRGQYDLLTNMTHNSEIARICTRLHGEVLSALLEGRTVSEAADSFIRNLAVNNFSKESELLHRAVYNPCQTDEELAERYAAGKSGTGYGFYVPETLAIAYDIFLGAGGDMQAAVYRAVNLGGDSDSTASIVVAMIACQSGGAYKEPPDMESVQGIEQLRTASTQLAEAALRQTVKLG